MTTEVSVSLTAREPANLVRRDFPLTVGVPFAPGVLKAGQAVSLLDSGGQSRPVQTRVMESHADGSVRWLLVDYQADFEHLQVAEHRLCTDGAGKQVAHRHPLVVTEKSGTMTIDNGLIKLEIEKQRCRLLLHVWRDGTLVSEGGLDFTVTSDDGKRFSAANDAQATFEIEESGALRTQVRWEGSHKDAAGKKHFDFVVLLTAYAGQRFIRVDHTFVNRLDADVTSIKEITASLPHALGDKLSYAACGPAWTGLHSSTLTADEPLEVDMFEYGIHHVATKTGKWLTPKKLVGRQWNLTGWAHAGNSQHGVLLAGKNFWQNYPKAVHVDEKSIQALLIPDRGSARGGFPVPRGMAKTHTFFLWFTHGQAEARPVVELAAQVQRWPQPAAPSEHYNESGQVWDFFPYYPRQYSKLEVAMRRFYEADKPIKFTNPPRVGERAYGLKHFGDFISVRDENVEAPDPDAPDTYYLNNEYDAAHVMSVMFLRTQDLAKFWMAEAHALHTIDVDTCHHAVPLPPTEFLENWRCLLHGQYRHCYQHIGGIQGLAEGHRPAEGSHTFAEGILDIYHMTGDRYYLDVATKTALHLAYMVNDSGYRWGLGRGAGWGMLVMAGVYQCRPLEPIKRACEHLMDSVTKSAADDKRYLDDRSVNLALRGIIKWHQVTGDERARKLILDLTDGFLKDCHAEEGLFLYSHWPEHCKHSDPKNGFANLESLAYCCDLTGDRRYIEAGLGMLSLAIDWILDPESLELPPQRPLRGPFRFMAIAHELGMLQRIPAAGGWLSPVGVGA